ncbi:MAG: hypothetical protein ACJ75H_18020 [Thermoanaerobaculia bacterium]
MQKRSMGSAWKVALAVVALAATAMALYVQIFEPRSRREEDRASAVRLEEALAESRVRLKTEILAELRAELAKQESTAQPDDQPLPNAVLRRSESGGGRTLQQVLDSQGSREAVLDGLARQKEHSDRALRRDLEELRAEVRRERDISGKTLSLLLAAMVPLVIHLLASLRLPER